MTTPPGRLRIIGRRLIVAGALLLPFALAAGYTFFRVIREFAPTALLTTFLVWFCLMLIGFGIAAIRSDTP